MKWSIAAASTVVLLSAMPPAKVRAVVEHMRGPNAVGVRIGGQGSWADWTPGGFK